MLKNCFSLSKFSRRLLSSQNVACDRLTQEKLLMAPFEYVSKLRCKHVTLVPSVFNHWLQVPEDKLDSINKASRDWVSWCLLLDDIQDDSSFRYGMPAAHRVFGVGVTINAANQALLLVQKQMKQLGHPLAPKVFNERMEDFFYGQGIDLYWQGKTIFPTEEAHLNMAMDKTGAFFRFPVDLMQLFSSNKTDYIDLVLDIGKYHEMIDDYYNLLHPKVLTIVLHNIINAVEKNNTAIFFRYCKLETYLCVNINEVKLLLQALIRLADEKQENHRLCSDITEGKITLAIIHASQFPDVATELADILKQRTTDPVLQNRVISLVKKHGSDEYTRNKLRELEADIRAQIDQLGGNPNLSAFMDDLSFQSHEPPPDQDLYS